MLHLYCTVFLTSQREACKWPIAAIYISIIATEGKEAHYNNLSDNLEIYRDYEHLLACLDIHWSRARQINPCYKNTTCWTDKCELMMLVHQQNYLSKVIK